MFFVLVVLVILILFAIWYIPWNLRKDKERQDQLIKRAESVAAETLSAANLVHSQQLKLTLDISKMSRTAADHFSEIRILLSLQEKLINSDMMSARRDELIRAKEAVRALERLMTVTTMSKQNPEAVDVLALNSARTRIEELEKILGIYIY